MEGLWFGIYISIAIFGCSKGVNNLALHGSTVYKARPRTSYDCAITPVLLIVRVSVHTQRIHSTAHGKPERVASCSISTADYTVADNFLLAL